MSIRSCCRGGARSIGRVVFGREPAARRDLTLTMGVLNRAVARRGLPSGLIFHSDRGVEFSAYAFRARLAALSIVQSMRRPRELGDNAFIESFFHSMKAEAIHARVFANDHTLREAVSSYIRRYNLTRLHSSLGYRSPIDYEKTVA